MVYLGKQPQQAAPNNPEMSQQNMVQDPLNALQNLASQGNRNQMMGAGGPNANQMSGGPGVGPAASNLLQTLNQQRPGQQQQHQMMAQMGGPGAGGMQMNVMGNAAGPGGVQQGQMVPQMGRFYWNVVFVYNKKLFNFNKIIKTLIIITQITPSIFTEIKYIAIYNS